MRKGASSHLQSSHPVEDPSNCTLQNAWPSLPRAYPSGLGEAIHEVITEQFQRPAHGDLRVNVAPDPMTSEITLFQEMEFEDWPDAKVKDAFDYLYNCKHCRIGWVIYTYFIPFIPPKTVC